MRLCKLWAQSGVGWNYSSIPKIQCRDFYLPKFQDIVRLKFWKSWTFPNFRTISVYTDVNFKCLWYTWGQNVLLQNSSSKNPAMVAQFWSLGIGLCQIQKLQVVHALWMPAVNETGSHGQFAYKIGCFNMSLKFLSRSQQFPSSSTRNQVELGKWATGQIMHWMPGTFFSTAAFKNSAR